MSYLGRAIGGMETKVVDASALRSILFGGVSKSGVTVNVDRALQVSAVLACVRVISEGIAQLPLKLYRESDDGTKTAAKEHTLYTKLWRKPNDFQTSFEWRETMVAHALLSHGGFSLINRSSSGEVLEFLPLMPGNVRVMQDPDYTVWYEVVTRAGASRRFDKQDVLHLKGLSWNAYSGLDPLFLGREPIGLSIATEESLSRLFSNGMRPSGVLSTDQKLQPDDRARIKKNFEEGHSALQNLFKVLLLDGGWKFSQMSLSPVDSQTHESRKHQIEEVCRVFRVFPQMIGYGDKTSTYASAEQFFMAHVTHTLMPWIERLEQMLATQLLTDQELAQGYFPKLNVSGLLRGDAKSRAEYYMSGIMNGWMTRNEPRRLEDLDPIAGLDEPLIPLNMSTQAEKDAAAKAAATKPPADPLAGVNQKSLARMLAEELDRPDLEAKLGRVISLANEKKLRQARDLVDEVIKQVDAQDAVA